MQTLRDEQLVTKFFSNCNKLFKVWFLTSKNPEYNSPSEIDGTRLLTGGYFRKTQNITIEGVTKEHEAFNTYKKTLSPYGIFELAKAPQSFVTLSTGTEIRAYNEDNPNFRPRDYDDGNGCNLKSLRSRFLSIGLGNGTIEFTVRKFVRPTITDKGFDGHIRRNKIQENDKVYDNFVVAYAAGRIQLFPKDLTVPMMINGMTVKESGSLEADDAAINHMYCLIDEHVSSLEKQFCPEKKKGTFRNAAEEHFADSNAPKRHNYSLADICLETYDHLYD